MALPWLIGAAVLGVGALLASSGDDSSSNNNGDDEERRRRERAERERREREQKEARQSVRAALNAEGERRAADFQKTLADWVRVEYQSTPPFKAAILQSGKQYKRVVDEFFTDGHALYPLSKETRDNLDEFEMWYDAKLTMTAHFRGVLDQMTARQKELQVLQDHRSRLEALRRDLRG